MSAEAAPVKVEETPKEAPKEEPKVETKSEVKEAKLVTSQPVLVTGASGFIAAHVVNELLAAGYKVRGTVRSVKDAQTKYKELYDLDKKGGMLELVEADLTTEGSFDKACEGVEYVMHLASPYVLNVKDAQKDLVDPAVRGTTSVLNSCLKAKTVKRVVVTSSMAAITDSPDSKKEYTEADWNTQSSLQRNPYYYSKKLAEEAAWSFAKEHKEFDVVVVNPVLVIGPELLTPKDVDGVNTSNKLFIDLLNGTYPAVMDLTWGLVDVRDVARAHLLCMTEKKAEGRHICCNQTVHMRDICAQLRTRYPKFKIPSRNLSGSVGSFFVKIGAHFEKPGTKSFIQTNLGKSAKFNNDKLKNTLGFNYREIWSSVADTCDWAIARGFAKAKA